MTKRGTELYDIPDDDEDHPRQPTSPKKLTPWVWLVVVALLVCYFGISLRWW